MYHFRALYQQDWPLDPDFPYLWRFDRTVAGAGSMADKGSHLVDLARYLVGEIEEVAAANEIFVKHRPLADQPGVRKEVTTDDAAVFLARFAGGAMGLFLTSRMSAGHKNCLTFEVNGSLGSLSFNLERLNELEVCFRGEQPEGFRTVMVTDAAEHRYIKNWWPPGHVLGWEHTFVHQYYEFFQAITGGYQPAPSFLDGLRNQEVLDAIEVAAREKCWEPVNRAGAAA
jgi:predicted dehydrogenase